MAAASLCSGVLQCVAVCCSVLQCVAVCCSVLQRHWDQTRVSQDPLTEKITPRLFGSPDHTVFPYDQLSDGDSRLLPRKLV